MARILIKGGRVWDGEKFFFADVAIEGSEISKIEPDINEKAEFVFDAKGKTVSAGLVDIHTHLKGISSDGFGINADSATLPFGVTAAADASAFNGDRSVLDSFGVNTAVFLCSNIKDDKANFDSALKTKDIYGDKVVGIKAYFDSTSPDVKSISPMKEIVSFARANGLRVMVHSSNPPTAMSELLAVLRPGDILTHAYHGGVNNVSDDGYECIKEAKGRGVIIDAGLAGFVHTDFEVFRGAIACGAIPDVISTDITKFSAYKRGGRYGLPMCMGIARYLGMAETDIFKAVTTGAAKAVGRENEWGTLKVGGIADIAVLEYVCGESFDMTDKAGNRLNSDTCYRNILTVLGGEIVYRR